MGLKGKDRRSFRAQRRWAGLLVLGLAVGLLVGGCATIRRARRAQDESKAPPGERTVRAAEVGLDANTVLTLGRALEIALKYHPAIVQAEQSVAIAATQFKDALAGYLPEVSGSLGSEVGTGNNGLQPSSSHVTTSFSEQIRLTMLLFDFGQTDSAIRAAYENKLAAEKRLLATRNDLAYQVRLAYYGLGKAEALEKISEDAAKRYADRLEQVKGLLAAGRRIQYDVTRAEVDLGNARLNLTRAADAVKTARANLNQSLGLAEDPGYRIAAPPEEDVSGTLDELMARAKENNPDLLALAAQVRSASAQVDGSIAALFPSISLGYNYSWTGVDFPLTWNWSLGPTLVASIFQGFQRLNYIDRSAAQLRSARASRSAQEQQIFAELTQGLAQLTDARSRKLQAEELIKSSAENLDIVKELYRVGRASALDLTDAELSYTSAQSEQAQAASDFLVAVAGIKHTVGEK